MPASVYLSVCTYSLIPQSNSELSNFTEGNSSGWANDNFQVNSGKNLFSASRVYTHLNVMVGCLPLAALY